jgi:hypothetical protein
MEQTGQFIPEERPQDLAGLLEEFVQGKAIAPEWQPNAK